MTLWRRFRFSASHRLHAEGVSAERNREIFGKCNNPFGHGHNYVVEVGVTGPVDPKLGTLCPLAPLDRIIRETVVDPFDHRNLNVDVPEFAKLVPTTENLAVVVEQRLRAAWTADLPTLAGVRIFETRNNIFEIQ